MDVSIKTKRSTFRRGRGISAWTMADKLEDVSPIEAKLHKIFLKHMRRRLRSNPIGKMRNLGPSLINPRHKKHVWQVFKNRFIFGSAVWYARIYESNTNRELLKFDAPLDAEIKKAIADHVHSEPDQPRTR